MIARILFALLAGLLLAAPASGYWQSRSQISISAAASYTGPGDIVPGASAWYGLRAYSSATRGTKAVNVCNALDVVCADLLTDATTGALVITTIGGVNCSIATCTIKTIYDQTTGNNCTGTCDLTQATIANRAIFNTGSLCTTASLPCMDAVNASGVPCYLSAGNITVNQPLSFSAVTNRPSAAGNYSTVIGHQTGNYGFYSQPGVMNLAWTADHTATASNAAFHATQAVSKGAGSSLYVDGSTTTFTSSTQNFGATKLASMADTTCTLDVARMYFAEFGIWPSDFGASVSTINSNQHSYWGF